MASEQKLPAFKSHSGPWHLLDVLGGSQSLWVSGSAVTTLPVLLRVVMSSGGERLPSTLKSAWEPAGARKYSILYSPGRRPAYSSGCSHSGLRQVNGLSELFPLLPSLSNGDNSTDLTGGWRGGF